MFNQKKQSWLVIRKEKVVMIFKILIIYLISIQFSYSNYIEKLKHVANARSDDYILVFYFEMSNCAKCFIEPYIIIDKLLLDKSIQQFKIIALIRCDRDIELRIFKNEYKWKYAIFRDDGNARKNLGASEESIITVIKPNQKKMHLSTGNHEKALLLIKEFMNK